MDQEKSTARTEAPASEPHAMTKEDWREAHQLLQRFKAICIYGVRSS